MDIREAQRYIKNQYFEKDSTRGLYSTFTWFIEEVGELADSLIKMNKEAIEEEIADVFAWLLSIANLVGVDLDEAFKKKYLTGINP
ncbi:MAG: MazG nucleotide pyrophosphohydrolase domain-containing protein [Desulfurococcaceae archaeon]